MTCDRLPPRAAPSSRRRTISSRRQGREPGARRAARAALAALRPPPTRGGSSSSSTPRPLPRGLRRRGRRMRSRRSHRRLRGRGVGVAHPRASRTPPTARGGDRRARRGRESDLRRRRRQPPRPRGILRDAAFADDADDGRIHRPLVADRTVLLTRWVPLEETTAAIRLADARRVRRAQRRARRVRPSRDAETAGRAGGEEHGCRRCSNASTRRAYGGRRVGKKEDYARGRRRRRRGGGGARDGDASLSVDGRDRHRHARREGRHLLPRRHRGDAPRARSPPAVLDARLRGASAGRRGRGDGHHGRGRRVRGGVRGVGGARGSLGDALREASACGAATCEAYGARSGALEEAVRTRRGAEVRIAYRGGFGFHGEEWDDPSDELLVGAFAEGKDLLATFKDSRIRGKREGAEEGR